MVVVVVVIQILTIPAEKNAFVSHNKKNDYNY